MTFQEFLQHIGLTPTSFWAVVAFLMSIGIEIIPKFKWSPWSALIKWIGSKFNSQIDKKMEVYNENIEQLRGEIKILDKKVDSVQNELSKHVTESEAKSLQDTRRDILDFCNACINKRRHTKEQFDFVITQCDAYEDYIKKNKIKNGVIEAAIKEIKRLYEKCIHENSFLKEGEQS